LVDLWLGLAAGVVVVGVEVDKREGQRRK